ncbi:MAG: hypothetical protein ACPL28_08750 [bacterium]
MRLFNYGLRVRVGMLVFFNQLPFNHIDTTSGVNPLKINFSRIWGKLNYYRNTVRKSNIANADEFFYYAQKNLKFSEYQKNKIFKMGIEGFKKFCKLYRNYIKAIQKFASEYKKDRWPT